MDNNHAKAIERALQDASSAYHAAAQAEMRYDGSMYNVYEFVRAARALDRQGQSLRRRFFVDSCNCSD